MKQPTTQAGEQPTKNEFTNGFGLGGITLGLGGLILGMAAIGPAVKTTEAENVALENQVKILNQQIDLYKKNGGPQLASGKLSLPDTQLKEITGKDTTNLDEQIKGISPEIRTNIAKAFAKVGISRIEFVNPESGKMTLMLDLASALAPEERPVHPLAPSAPGAVRAGPSAPVLRVQPQGENFTNREAVRPAAPGGLRAK